MLAVSFLAKRCINYYDINSKATVLKKQKWAIINDKIQIMMLINQANNLKGRKATAQPCYDDCKILIVMDNGAKHLKFVVYQELVVELEGSNLGKYLIVYLFLHLIQQQYNHQQLHLKRKKLRIPQSYFYLLIHLIQVKKRLRTPNSLQYLIFQSMALCECLAKQPRQARKKKTGPYQKTNAYTQQISREQIITLIIFIAQLICHSVFIVPTLPKINHSILWIMLGLHYVLLVVIGIDYVYLTIKDPVDKILINQQFITKYLSSELKYCMICDSQVHINSHHCMRCDRCTQQFDHHCKFLNNCIGSRNYQAFFRLLLTYSFYGINILGMAGWTGVRNFKDQSLAFQGNKWGIVALAIFSLIVLAFVLTLMFFHCYITIVENTTTYGHTYEPRKSNTDVQRNKPNIQIWGPNSGERLKYEQRKIQF